MTKDHFDSKQLRLNSKQEKYLDLMMRGSGVLGFFLGALAVERFLTFDAAMFIGLGIFLVTMIQMHLFKKTL